MASARGTLAKMSEARRTRVTEAFASPPETRQLHANYNALPFLPARCYEYVALLFILLYPARRDGRDGASAICSGGRSKYSGISLF